MKKETAQFNSFTKSLMAVRESFKHLRDARARNDTEASKKECLTLHSKMKKLEAMLSKPFVFSLPFQGPVEAMTKTANRILRGDGELIAMSAIVEATGVVIFNADRQHVEALRTTLSDVSGAIRMQASIGALIWPMRTKWRRQRWPRFSRGL